MKRSKHGLFVFPPKKTLIWRRHCSIGQSCCSKTWKRSIDWFLESSSGMNFFSAERSLNQPKVTRVCIRSTNQWNRSISVRLYFLFCSRVSFQGHMKIAPFEIFLMSSIWFGYHTIDTNKFTHKQINKQINKWLTQSECIGLINNKNLWPLTSCLSMTSFICPGTYYFYQFFSIHIKLPYILIKVNIFTSVFFIDINFSHIYVKTIIVPYQFSYIYSKTNFLLF